MKEQYWNEDVNNSIRDYLKTENQKLFKEMIYPALCSNARYWIKRYGVNGRLQELVDETVSDAFVKIFPKLDADRKEGFFSFFNLGIKNLVFNTYVAKEYQRKKSGCTYSEDLLSPEDFVSLGFSEDPQVRHTKIKFFIEQDGVGKQKKYKKFVDENKSELEDVINSVEIEMSYKSIGLVEFKGRYQVYDAISERFPNLPTTLLKYILRRVRYEINDVIDN